METQTLTIYNLKEVDAISPIVIPGEITELWRIVYPTLKSLPVFVSEKTDFHDLIEDRGMAALYAKMGAWLSQKAAEYKGKLSASESLSDLTAGVTVSGKTGTSDMPVTSTFSTVGTASSENALSGITETETVNSLETPAVRLAEIAERYPNFYREFVSEFCDTFGVYVYQGREL